MWKVQVNVLDGKHETPTRLSSSDASYLIDVLLKSQGIEPRRVELLHTAANQRNLDRALAERAIRDLEKRDLI